ncbi:MAG: SDR family oxidoreductase [Hormoscilla sp. GM102CHS1]|nr:SDR family oxidoreductase [Hormoscilla sp. GM102CHS1]
MACALVTGGVRRIGRALAQELALLGYDLAIHYRSSSASAERLRVQIESQGRTCKIYQANLERDRDIINLLGRVKADFQDLEVLVNNASIFEPATIKNTEMELFDRHLAVNLKAPFFLIRDFARFVGTGNIINIIDTRMSKNDYTYAAYTLAKKSLADLTSMAALELAPDIRVNGIAPGFILAPEGASHDYLDKLKQKLPMCQQGNVKQICQAMIYLLENDFVTGQLLFVDGGQHL